MEPEDRQGTQDANEQETDVERKRWVRKAIKLKNAVTRIKYPIAAPVLLAGLSSASPLPQWATQERSQDANWNKEQPAAFTIGNAAGNG